MICQDFPHGVCYLLTLSSPDEISIGLVFRRLPHSLRWSPREALNRNTEGPYFLGAQVAIKMRPTEGEQVEI